MKRVWMILIAGVAVLGLAGAATGFALAQTDGEGPPDQPVDTDGDRLPDELEERLNDCPSATDPDSDNDHLPDGLEAFIGTNICKADSDGDRLPDGVEIYLSAMRRGDCPHPLDRDSDGDGWLDGVEVVAKTRPCDPRSHPRWPGPDAES